MDKVVECQIEKYARLTAQAREWESVSNSSARPLALVLTKSGVLKVEAGRVLLEYWDLRLAKDVRTHRRAHNLLFLCNTKGSARKWRVMFSGEPPAAEERCVRCLRAIQAFLSSPNTSHLYPHTLTDTTSLPLVPHTLANRLSSHALIDAVPRPHSLTDAPLCSPTPPRSGSHPASSVSTLVGQPYFTHDVPPFVEVQARNTTSLRPELQSHTSPHPSPAGVKVQPAGVQPNTLPHPTSVGVQSDNQAPILSPKSSMPLVYSSTMTGSVAGHRDSLVSCHSIASSFSSPTHTLSLPSCASVDGTLEPSDFLAGRKKAKLIPHPPTPINSCGDPATQSRDPDTQSRGSNFRVNDPSNHGHSSDTQGLDPNTRDHDPDIQNRETDTQDQDTQGRDLDSKVHDTDTQDCDLNSQASEGSIVIIDSKITSHSPVLQSTGQAPVLQSRGQAPILQSTGQAPILQSTDQAPILQSTGQAPILLSTVQAPVLLSTGQAPILQSTGQAPILQSTGQAPILLSTGQAPVLLSTGQAPILQSTGQAPILQSTGQAPILQSTGQAPVLQSTGHNLIPEKAVYSQVLSSGGHAPSVASLGPWASLEQLVRAVLEDPSLPDVVDAVHRIIGNM
ncbi:uncharacterized protein [Procambarus clarkii]|uniref:uncharacterized protein n=1 Tax=Procambarus clarkii TaxID=6728 RepID=UPI0037422A23